jgi:hypothetical protein
MRYLIAIVSAIVFAALAMVFVSSPVASFVARQFTFNSPDTADSLHMAVFLAANFSALVIGFLVGWALGPRTRSA